MTYLMQQFGDELSDIHMRNIDSDSLHEIIGEFAPLLGVAVNDREKSSVQKETSKDEVDGGIITIEPIQEDSTASDIEIKVEVDEDLVKEVYADATAEMEFAKVRVKEEIIEKEPMNEPNENEGSDYVEVKVEVDDDYIKEMYNKVSTVSETRKRKIGNNNEKKSDKTKSNNKHQDNDLNDKLVCKIQTKKVKKSKSFLNAPVKTSVSVKQEILNVPVITPSNGTFRNNSDNVMSKVDKNKSNTGETEVEGNKVYKCKLCSKKYETSYHLNRHVITHGGVRPYSCDKCSKSFTQKCDLNRHMHVHTEERAFECKVCGKSFKRSDYLSKHERRYCTLQRDRRCSKCNVLYGSVEELRDHKCPTMKDGATFTCEHCEEVYLSVEALVEHRKVHVNTEKEHQCIRCKEKFNDFMAYVDHFRNHNTDRPYTCDLCQKTFSRNHNLMTHMWIHNTEKQYTCEICAKTFTYFSNLQVHLRVHRNERPYICLECDKGFLTSSDLRRHQRTHSGEKPYKCPHCPAKYARKERMISHLVVHMEEGETSRADEESKGYMVNSQDTATAPIMVIGVANPVLNGTSMNIGQTPPSVGSITEQLALGAQNRTPVFLIPAQSVQNVQTNSTLTTLNGQLALGAPKSSTMYLVPSQNHSLQNVQISTKISNINEQQTLGVQKGSSMHLVPVQSKDAKTYTEMSDTSLVTVKKEHGLVIKQERVDPDYTGQPVNFVKQEPVDTSIVKQEPVN